MKMSKVCISIAVIVIVMIVVIGLLLYIYFFGITKEQKYSKCLWRCKNFIFSQTDQVLCEKGCVEKYK